MQTTFDWRGPVWLAVLVALSVGLSLGLACAVPLAAFAAMSALTMPRRAALVLVLAVVLANQCVGFTLLHYPFTPGTWVWGLAFALVGVLAVPAATWAFRSMAALPIVAQMAAFLAAFMVYEGGLFLLTVAASNGLEPYAAPVVLRVFLINAAAFVGLMICARIAGAIGLAGAARMHQRAV